jgi:hypothetical protein
LPGPARARERSSSTLSLLLPFEILLFDLGRNNVARIGSGTNPTVPRQGFGEMGIVGTAATVANAIFNATGRRVRDFPITLDKLLTHLPDAG